MPLVSSGNGVAGAGQAEQQDLPAWLESLRAHERPVSSGQENRQPFSLDELVDENSMPSWMRQDRHKMPENGSSDSFPAIPAMPASAGLEKQNMPSSGFQASSLIDEHSLPSWMRESQGQGQTGAQPGVTPAVSAHSLVDQQGLPSWIRDLSQANVPQTSTQAPARNQPGGLPIQTPITPPAMTSPPHVPQTPPAQEPSAAFMQGFSAHDLLDVQSMPGWMSGLQGPGQGPGAPPTRPVPTEQGFSAGELVDQRSVPQWMKNSQGQEKVDPQSAMGVPVNGSGQMMGTGQGRQGTASSEGMPAGSLLDQNSLPSWLQENQLSNPQAPQPAGPGMSAGSPFDAGAAPSWMREALQSSANDAPPAGLGMPAGSPFDAGAAPSWMRDGLQNGIYDAPQAEQGMSAGSLLDAGSAPSWMRDGLQSGANGAPPVGQGISAGSLLDAGAVPSWMREGLQGGAPEVQLAGQGISAGSLLDMNTMPAWMREGEQGRSQADMVAGQGMSAGSLIDMNAMPAWLRNEANQPGAGGRPGQMTARPVPSRPRHEGAPQEQSEAAASIFASMLGVSASTPALPGQEQQMPATYLGAAQGQPVPSLPPFQQAQPGIPGWQQPDMNRQQPDIPGWQQPDMNRQQPDIPGWQQPDMNRQQPDMNLYNQGAQPRSWQMSGPMPTIGSQPAPNAYAPTGQAGNPREMPPRLNHQEAPAWNGFSAQDRTSLGVTSSAEAGNYRSDLHPGNAQNTDTKKKGFFDSIRDFFSK